MNIKYFETLNSSFLAHYARRLADLIIEQGSKLLKDLDISVPTTSISTILYISKNGAPSVATLAEELGVTHQMASQRINLLEKMLMVERANHPTDKRAKIVRLTKLGVSEAEKLIPFTKQMDKVFDELETEVGCQLTQVIRQTELSLLNRPLYERINKKSIRNEK